MAPPSKVKPSTYIFITDHDPSKDNIESLLRYGKSR